jgi:hypothetical protein
MAELKLTEAEQKAELWSDLDDDVLGKVVRAGLFSIKTLSEQERKMTLMSAGIILASIAAEFNADTLTQKLEGLTNKGVSIGDWKITVKRLKP